MNFHRLLEHVVQDLWPSLATFRPELRCAPRSCWWLLSRMILPRWKSGPYYVMLFGTAAALLLACQSAQWILHGKAPAELDKPLATFTGLLAFDGLTVVLRRAPVGLPAVVRRFHASDRRAQRGGLDRVLRHDARRHAGHVPDGLGNHVLVVLPGRRDGQRSVLCVGRPAPSPT